MRNLQKVLYNSCMFKFFMEVQIVDLPTHLTIDQEFQAQNLHQCLQNLHSSTFPCTPNLIQPTLLQSACQFHTTYPRSFDSDTLSSLFHDIFLQVSLFFAHRRLDYCPFVKIAACDFQAPATTSFETLNQQNSTLKF